jgi:hypothetical protein
MCHGRQHLCCGQRRSRHQTQHTAGHQPSRVCYASTSTGHLQLRIDAVSRWPPHPVCCSRWVRRRHRGCGALHRRLPRCNGRLDPRFHIRHHRLPSQDKRGCRSCRSGDVGTQACGCETCWRRAKEAVKRAWNWGRATHKGRCVGTHIRAAGGLRPLGGRLRHVELGQRRQRRSRRRHVAL